MFEDVLSMFEDAPRQREISTHIPTGDLSRAQKATAEYNHLPDNEVGKISYPIFKSLSSHSNNS